MRVARKISDGSLIEMQSADAGGQQADLDVLKNNAIASGVPENDIEVLFMTPAQYAAAFPRADSAAQARLALDEQQRIAVRNDSGQLAWLNMTPDEAAQWVNDTHAARVAAGDTQVQAVLFILRRFARILLVVARAVLRRNAQGQTALDQGGAPRV